MDKDKGLPTLVWSIDPEETKDPPSKSSLESLKNYRVFPVSIQQTDTASDYQVLETYLIACRIENIESPVIFTKGRTDGFDIDQILNFATSKHAELIALTSHGKTGLKKIILGTFAEKLLAKSYFPILFLSKDEIDQSSHRAIFATDFSEESSNALQSFLKFAKHSVNEVTIFHTEPLPANFYKSFDIPGDLGVYLHKVIHGSCGSIARDIRDVCAKEKIGLIGITSKKSKLNNTLFGSVAQDLFRHQEELVWVSNSRLNEIR
jgi:hypothetical protein